ncbi:DUF4371 domain-containing protein, partial [Trichonephila clavata]
LLEKPTERNSTAIAVQDTVDRVKDDHVCMEHVKEEEPSNTTFFENVNDKSFQDLGKFTNKILSDRNSLTNRTSLFKHPNPIRWSSRVNTIPAIKLRFFNTIKAFSEIVLKSPNKDKRGEAEIIKTKMSTFEFVLLCELMHRVLNDINYASKIIQKLDIDLDETISFSRDKSKIANL